VDSWQAKAMAGMGHDYAKRADQVYVTFEVYF
jgi:hypothetical protein